MQRYAITDRRLLPPATWKQTLHDQVGQWAAAGVNWIQLREKDLPQAELLTLAQSLAALIRSSPSKLLVNGLPPHLARRAGAAGVHLPSGWTPEQIEAAAATGAVTVSCHTLFEIEQARQATAILWAPVFGKSVDGAPVHPGTGLATLAQACVLAAPTPVFALGGVTPANAQSCVDAGAAGVAGIRLFHGEAWRSLA